MQSNSHTPPKKTTSTNPTPTGYSQTSFTHMAWLGPRIKAFGTTQCSCGNRECKGPAQCPCSVEGPDGITRRCPNQSAHCGFSLRTPEGYKTRADEIRQFMDEVVFDGLRKGAWNYPETLREWCRALARWSFCSEHDPGRESQKEVSWGLDCLWAEVQRRQEELRKELEELCLFAQQNSSAAQCDSETESEEEDEQLRTPPAPAKKRLERPV